jgi:ABC-type dipeptide/oligopeptide/nickel transport system ATPase component
MSITKSSKENRNLIFNFCLALIAFGATENVDHYNSRILDKKTHSFDYRVLAENDSDDDDSRRSNKNRNSQNNQNVNPKDDDYEPQCNTPVWAMCTKRKKKHTDD